MDLEGKAGTKRNLGEADFFAPLAQDADTLLFADIRTRLDDQDSREGNFGLGIRHMLPTGWNVGAYGYFDRRRTHYDNYYNQATFGAEALGEDWDFRANAYLPFGRDRHEVESLNTAELSGTSVIFRGGEERALAGFDGEVGWRVPLFGADAGRQLRVYGGGYRFYADDVDPVQGPRGRLDLTFDEVPYLWSGARLSLGAEVQNDGPRGTQAFASVRLRIPLQIFGAAPSSKLTAQERRMTDPVVRDIDIVAQAGAFGVTETATATAGGSTITVLSSASTSGAALPGAVTAAGANSTVILSGTFNTTTTVSMAGAQTLMGAGTLTVKSPSGRTATLTTPGGTIAGTNVNSSALQLNSNATVSGLTVSNAYSGGAGGIAVLMAGAAGNLTILNSTFTVTQSGNNGGAAMTGGGNNANVLLSGNTFTAIGSGTATTMTGLGINGGNTTITVTGNTISASGGNTNNFMASVAGATILSGSTGNVRGSGTCNGAPNSGTLGFTNGTTCP